MEVRAVAKYVRVQPRKVRQVAREVRGKSAMPAANVLRFHPSKGAFVLHKVLMSAIANAEANHGLDGTTLQIKEIRVDEGPRMKRIQARAMGRANRIVKRTSHITVVVEDVDREAEVKDHGTKAKARPSFAKSGGKKKAAAKKEAAAEPVAEEALTDEVAVDTSDVKAEAADQAPEAEAPATEVVEQESVEEQTPEKTVDAEEAKADEANKEAEDAAAERAPGDKAEGQQEKK